MQTLANRKFDPPFSIRLSGDLPDGEAEIRCRAVVRELPGRRIVCAATWNGRDVYAKIYLDRWRAKVHWLREDRGIRALQQHEILAPPLLYSGFAEADRVYVLVLGAIEPSATFSQAWERTVGAGKRRALLRSMAHVFARLHEAGLIQTDPHLNNFLVSDGRIYTLDGSDIKRSGAPIAKPEALRNLAIFFAIFRSENDSLVPEAFREYAAVRRWSEVADDTTLLEKHITRTRESSRADYLRQKIFRTSTPFVAHTSLRRRWVCSRRYDTPAMRDLLHAPDEYIDCRADVYLKQGRSSTVAVVTLGDARFVVKRYNTRNLWHALRHAVKRPRAVRSWVNAHRLRICGIATADPVAFVEKRFGPFTQRAYLITRYVDGPHLFAYLTEPAATDRQGPMVRRVVELFRALSRCRLLHGDLKATNIIVDGDAPVLMDLDSMGLCKSTPRFRVQFKTELLRFLRNWDSSPGLRAEFVDQLEAVFEDVILKESESR